MILKFSETYSTFLIKLYYKLQTFIFFSCVVAYSEHLQQIISHAQH